MIKTLLILLFPVCAAAQCGYITHINAPIIGDSLHISWTPAANADFYYVYVRKNQYASPVIYFTGSDSINVLSPAQSGYSVFVRPSCQPARCCTPHK